MALSIFLVYYQKGEYNIWFSNDVYLTHIFLIKRQKPLEKGFV